MDTEPEQQGGLNSNSVITGGTSGLISRLLTNTLFLWYRLHKNDSEWRQSIEKKAGKR